MTEFTNKDIYFISDPDQARVILDRLKRIDNYVILGDHEAVVLNAASVIESIVEELYFRYKTRFNESGKPDKAKYDDRIKWLNENSKLFNWKSNDQSGLTTYVRFDDVVFRHIWNVRNRIHIAKDAGIDEPITLAVAQFAVAVLNAVIEYFHDVRDFGSKNWNVPLGIAQFLKPKGETIRFQAMSHPNFREGNYGAIVMSSALTEDFKITGQYEITSASAPLFGIIYNWDNHKGFRIIRLDRRRDSQGNPLDDGCFSSDGLPDIKNLARFEKSPDLDELRYSFEVTFKMTKEMRVYFNDDELHLQGSSHELDQWEYDPSKRVGFWVEQGTCLLHDVDVQPV